MFSAYIGLGSNLGQPEQQIKKALVAIENISSTHVTAISSLYYSRPMGPQDQPDYMNAVVNIATELTPLALLDALQAIELAAGRERKEERWGARTLDLDILLYDNLVVESERLTLPHYGIKVREFVLLPLAEVAPSLVLPDNSTVKELAASIPINGLKIHSQLR